MDWTAIALIAVLTAGRAAAGPLAGASGSGALGDGERCVVKAEFRDTAKESPRVPSTNSMVVSSLGDCNAQCCKDRFSTQRPELQCSLFA